MRKRKPDRPGWVVCGVRGVLTTVVAVVLSMVVAPAVHWVAPPESWPDRVAAGSLDRADEMVAALGGDTAAEWVSDLLQHSGLTLFNPGGWHGPDTLTTSGSATTGFFEGWYYKCVTAGGRTVVLIPGAIYGDAANKTFAFVMLVDPAAPDTADQIRLFKYPVGVLQASRGPGTAWTVRVGPSTFGPAGVTVHLDDGATAVHVEGTLRFEQAVGWPASAMFPDVMGWFAWVPWMECRHGVVALDADVVGELNIRGEPAGFGRHGGRAYVEKDWGSTFPKTWVWLQSNHFRCERDEASAPWCRESVALLLSVASVPFPSDQLEAFRFRGFLGGLRVGSKLYRFASYNGAVIERLDASQHGAVTLSIRTAQYRLQVWALGNKTAAAVLYGPVPGGGFEPFVNEMLGAMLQVTLTRRVDGEVLYRGVGEHGGLEIESMEPGGLDLLK